jgi:hypothetical protein
MKLMLEMAKLRNVMFEVLNMQFSQNTWRQTNMLSVIVQHRASKAHSNDKNNSFTYIVHRPANYSLVLRLYISNPPSMGLHILWAWL